MTEEKRKPAANSTFAIGGVSCSADSLAVAESFVLRINICGEKPAHRKSAKRYGQVYEQTTKRQSEQTRELPEEKFYSS